MNLPSDIANQALDAIGSEVVLGDIEDGTRPAQVCLRAYRQCLMQLLRTAPWDFARKTAPLVLLADATGQTADVGTLVPQPWVYEYTYPTDCVKARFVIHGQVANSITPPITPVQVQYPWLGYPGRAARFLVATDHNYPPPPGQITWEVQGVSPASRTVVLTDIQNAQLVYTALMLYPSVWDPLFRAAMVAYLASEVALALTTDKKLGLQLRDEQIKIAKLKLDQARLADGNEGITVMDIPTDWIQARSACYGYGSLDRYSGYGYGYDSCTFADGSIY